MRLPLALGMALSAALTLASTGCGETKVAPAPTVTVTQPAPTETATKKATRKPDDQPTETEKAAKKVLPNVVGMNLQKGQDTMQAAGFYLLNDKDATGQNRFQIYDRNWVVTRQTPAAGRRVAVDTLITLYAKKIGE